jgi:hypothetical protein
MSKDWRRLVEKKTENRKQEVFHANVPSDACEIGARDVAGAVSLCDSRIFVCGSVHQRGFCPAGAAGV